MSKIITADYNGTPREVFFLGQPLITLLHDDRIYVAMKPIVENVGLDWDAQRQRIKRDEVLSEGAVMITAPSNGGIQQMLCLPIDYLNGWLFGIDVNRVKPEIRETLIAYKRECYQVLYEYWHSGKTALRRRRKPAHSDDLSAIISPEQAGFIKYLLTQAQNNVPEKTQKGFVLRGLFTLKATLGVDYRKLTQAKYAEALCVLAGYINRANEPPVLQEPQDKMEMLKPHLRSEAIAYMIAGREAHFRQIRGITQAEKALGKAKRALTLQGVRQAERALNEVKRALTEVSSYNYAVFRGLYDARHRLCFDEDTMNKGRLLALTHPFYAVKSVMDDLLQ